MKTDSPDYLNNLRHSTAHLLAAAVMELWPDTKRTIGPAIENGFYFDFEFSHPVSEEDFPTIEKKMHEIIHSWKTFERHELPPEKAKEEYPENAYKHELIDEFASAGESLTFYKSGDYWDLCKGGHVDHPDKEIAYFKLLKVAGAYWRGDEKNTMLSRIYATAFPTQKELDDYLLQIEEAKKRDHRKIGKELELYTISNEVGPGITIWMPNGSVIRREIEDYMVQEQIAAGFKHVYSPHIGQKSLWEKSGHWDLYREKMYSPMDVDGVEYLVKPMTCPMHIQTYQFRPRSYRELPIRIAEIGSVYRYEQSGELAGLLRVRAFTQDDAHIFCTPDQAVDEFLSVFNFIQKLYALFGFTDYRVRLGIRSSKEKYLGSDELWEQAQEKAIEALKKNGSPYYISEGDAAFYGPKADFMVKDALGREWQCGTVQIDFMLPERFGMKYVDHDGKEKTPVMIHRAPLGSLERFLAILIENYAGNFPTWLSPVQVKVLPITERNLVYADKVGAQLLKHKIRVDVDRRNESLGAKIRKAQEEKVAYMLIVGDKEEKENTVSQRRRSSKDQNQVEVDEFIRHITEEIREKK